VKYRATIYLDDGEDAAAWTDGTEPFDTIDEAVAAGRALAKERGWPMWSGTVEAGDLVPWTPEPGVHLTEWKDANEDRPSVAYFGTDWDDREEETR
jgi:hypothetical protein